MSIGAIGTTSFAVTTRYTGDDGDPVSASGSHARHLLPENARADATPDQAIESESSMTAMLVGGDIGAQVAALAILSAKSQREAAGRLQLAEEAALEREEAAQVAALHDKADDIRLAGLVEGGFTALGGVCTLAGSFAAPESSARTRSRGAAELAEAGAKVFGNLPKAAETDEQARAESHDHAAGHYRRALETNRDSRREGQDLLERALDFYKQNQQGLAEATNTSVRRG